MTAAVSIRLRNVRTGEVVEMTDDRPPDMEPDGSIDKCDRCDDSGPPEQFEGCAGCQRHLCPPCRAKHDCGEVDL